MKRVADSLTSTSRKSEGTDQTLTVRRSTLGSNFWLSLTILGGAIVTISLASYQTALSIGTSSGIEQDGLLEQDAYATLLLVIVGLAVTFLGLTYLLRTIPLGRRPSSIMETISSILSQKRFTKIFALSGLAYGFAFAAVSSTLVYQPGLTFSEAYGVQVPSIVPVVCCGPIGQIPQFVLYLTQQFAILLIPLNLVLLFAVSWLVGLNTAIAAFAYKNRPKLASGKWLVGLGAITGLFTACPTCAGFFFLTILGLGGAVSLSLTLATLQTYFITAGIPVLAVTPILTCRQIRNNSLASCTLS